MGLNGWPWRIPHIEQYLNIGHWTHAAFSIEKIRATRSISERDIVMIGGSACLEGIVSDYDLQYRINKSTNNKFRFTSICSSYMSFSDIGKIVARLDMEKSIILLAIEPPMFGKTLDDQLTHRRKDTGIFLPKFYFLKLPEKIGNVLEKYGYDFNTAHDLLSYLSFSPVEMMKLIRAGIPAYLESKEYPYIRHHLNESASENKIIDYVNKLEKQIPVNRKLNEDLLKAVIELGQKNNNRVILVNLPNAEPYADEILKGFPDYMQFINKITRQYNSELIDMHSDVHWPSDLFWDAHHLKPVGRVKFTQTLASELANISVN